MIGLEEISSLVEPVTFVVEDTILGGPKNDVMSPLAFGFFASERAASVALRFRDIIADGRRKRYRRDSLDAFDESLEESVSFGGWEKKQSRTDAVCRSEVAAGVREVRRSEH